MTETKKLYRSRHNRIIAGVCGGLGEYFNIDPVLVRVAFLVLSVIGGSGILLYVVLVFIVPLQPGNGAMPSGGEKVEEFAKEVGERAKDLAHEFASGKEKAPEHKSKENQTSGRNIFGFLLVAIGLILFLNAVLPQQFFRWNLVWPILIVFIGISVLLNSEKKSS